MRVLITGISGSTGSHLSDLLMEEGHTVAGLVRGQQDPKRHPGQLPYTAVRGDLTDYASLISALRDVQPDRVYHLGAVTSIGQSWRQQELMTNVTGMGTLRLLQAVRFVCPEARVVIAASADQFGEYAGDADTINDQPGLAADENTPFAPRTPYAVAKQFSYDTARTYRQAYEMHVSTLLLFNHTGPRHGAEFVVRKVTDGAARIARKGGKLSLGSLNAQRDWGYAPEYAKVYPLAAECGTPDDYVIATGELRSLRDLCSVAFDAVNLDWEDHVIYDPFFSRPNDVVARVGNAAKARQVLGWSASKPFEEMIGEMVRSAFTDGTDKAR